MNLIVTCYPKIKSVLPIALLIFKVVMIPFNVDIILLNYCFVTCICKVKLAVSCRNFTMLYVMSVECR